MSDVHELIESIRVTLASSLDHNREELEELHASLDGYVRSANKRLRECDGLLANGHRSEAIQLAEQEPNLLEFVGILDFPELDEWNDFVAEHGLKVAPELQIDIATDLNHAYSDDTPLERYLNKLRVYSIGRAPLRSRIEILRKIAKLDVESPHWQDDLKSYEKVRMRQMQDEYRAADNAKDYEKLAELYSEIKNNKWSVKPNKQFVEDLTNSLGSLHQRHSLVQLRDTFRLMRTAKENGDLETCTRLADEWYKIAEQCDHTSESYQLIEAKSEAALQWVENSRQAQETAEEKKRETDKFRRMLRSPRATIRSLEAKYESLVEDGADLPEAVVNQYYERIAEIERQEDLRKKLKIGGIALGVIVVLVFALMAFFGGD